jgi:predicted GNAT family acetyltransferase
MIEINRFDDFRDYAKFNQEFIDSNPMLYYHLENTIKRVFKGKGRQPQLYKFFNITGDNCFVAVLLIDNECLIYADNINDDVVDKLSEGLEFHLFKRYQFFGTKQIIDALFQKHKVEYDEQKYRIIYECKSILPDFEYSPGKMRMADEERLFELAAFNVAFTKEYYGDTQDLEKAIQLIASGITNDNLYQWDFENNICAMAQAIHGDYDFPVIGHVFTNPNFRGKGYAASIVHRLTKGLLEAGAEKCMLSTNAYTPASNRAFIKAGYIQNGEYVVRYKKK